METQKRINKKAKRVSPGSRVEPMITPALRNEFRIVLKAQRLLDLPSSFSDPDFFDEVPLYSRYEQVAFLRQHGDVDQLLLELSLEYLQRVFEKAPPAKSRRLLAVTIIRDDEKEPIVPSILLCNTFVRSQFCDLFLAQPSTRLGKGMQTLLDKNGHSEEYRALEDRSTLPDDVRVFVSYKTVPDGLVSLDELMTDAAEPSGTKMETGLRKGKRKIEPSNNPLGGVIGLREDPVQGRQRQES